MKKLLAILCMVGAGFSLFARPVAPATALKAAQVFYQQTMPASLQNEMPNMSTVSLPYVQTNASEPEFYIYSTPGTFIIIAGDDASIPIIAYSNEGSLSSGKSVPEGFIKWMDKVKREIQYIREQQLEADEAITESWDRLLNNKPFTTATNAVSPLIATKWDQSPYYNALCPYDNTYGQRTVVGCVATAMAQIMKYYNYPTTGTGSHSYNHARYGTLSANFGATTYNWASMPNSVTSANSAVATLSYHCGVAVDMDYNVGSQGGSGAYPSALPNAYKSYFGYASTVTYYTRSSYSDATWISMMKTELDAARPVQYSGQGTNGGHSFVMDGYDNSNNFHFNWGWSGSSDGYFAINALNPGSLGTGGGSGGFNAYQTAIIGIKPPAGGGGGGGNTMDMRLYSAITVNPNPIDYNSSFTVSCQVANYGTSTAQNFSGDFTAAVFNSSNQFVSYVETKTGYTLNYNSYFTNPIVFSTSAISALTPGTYTIGIYYKATGASQWTAFANGSYQNFISVVVKGNDVNDLKLYAPIVTTPTIITQNQTFTVTFDIANYSTSAFNGIVTVDIHKSDGTWIRELDRKTGISLPSNTHFTNGLTYTITGGIDTIGTFQLFVWDQPSGGGWEVLGNGTYANPITITVVAPGLTPDGYENDNTQSSAALLNMNFSGTTGSVKTNAANIHNGTDIDYYYVDLPAGYNYLLSPRVHDGYNTGDGNTYSCDVMFAYSTDGVSYSSSIDDVMSGNISKTGGGRVYFVVSPFFTGKTGTYALEIRGTRTVAGGINNETARALRCYPNPARDYVNLELPDDVLADAVITDINGRTLSSLEHISGTTEVNTSGWPAGIYFIKAITGKQEVYNAKFIISR